MNIHAREITLDASPVAGAATPLDPEAVRAAAEAASRKVAPLWPLKHFVAVNPYLGLVDQPFETAARTVAETAGARTRMPRAFYAEAIANGRIKDADLKAALHRADRPGVPGDVATLKRKAAEEPAAEPAPLPTVADVVARTTGRDAPTLAQDRISTFAAAYFDEGQALWPMPWRHLPPFKAWRAFAAEDRTLDVLGIGGVRAFVADLPEDAGLALTASCLGLGLGEEGLDRYFHRLLATVGGWAAYARYRMWQAELAGATDDTPLQLLAIRAAFDAALLSAHGDDHGVGDAWSVALASHAAKRSADVADPVETILQDAYEIAFQRTLVSSVGAQGKAPAADRPDVQAAFCIDVRSEIVRRALEDVTDRAETLGFAGFFGVPLEVVPFGEETGGAHCPVLFSPAIVVPERMEGSSGEAARARHQLAVHRTFKKAWIWFKNAAVSSFAFVETMGLGYIARLTGDSLARRPRRFQREGLDPALAARIGPCVAPDTVAGRTGGILPDQRVEIAATVLNAMSLTKTFARIVLLAGHGSSTANNPHATALDCGACGGHTGEANARVTADILNDPYVRAGLEAKGIHVPADTVFVAGLHDTMTDEVTLFDTHDVPESHAADLERLKGWLAEAARRARRERSGLLGLSSEAGDLDELVDLRTRDWSQVRPEWGLAGCAAFIAAPRERTRGLSLKGRAFLHTYDWTADEGFGVLELIMTAPVVVASWISLQYYGSTVDNRVFGSGNKVLHNVVGTLGVLEGNAGDLRTGLPWQSVHDGERLVHEPMRLNVVIEAPLDAMNAVIEAHESVRHLVDNGWLHLFAIGADGRVNHKYAGGLSWQPVDDALTPAQSETAA